MSIFVFKIHSQQISIAISCCFKNLALVIQSLLELILHKNVYMSGDNLDCINSVINILPNYWYSHTLREKPWKKKTINKNEVPNSKTMPAIPPIGISYWCSLPLWLSSSLPIADVNEQKLNWDQTLAIERFLDDQHFLPHIMQNIPHKPLFQGFFYIGDSPTPNT